MRAPLDKRTTKDLIRLGIFIVVTTLCTGLLVLTIGNISFGGRSEYRAEFVDATGVVEGDDVRIAGVKVGNVTDVSIEDRNRAIVSFTVDESAPLTQATNVAIRYRNLVGQRYLSLTQPIGEAAPLEEGATIPAARTTPALDLTVLFNGFKPLFQALSPTDINKLSYEIVQVFQGEGGTMESLLSHTASVTQTLADRDQVIDSLIDNLNEVLDHVADRDQQLSELIVTFKDFVTGLNSDREAILSTLDGISTLSVETAGLVKEMRSPFVEDIRQLRRLASNLDQGKEEIDRAVQVLPVKLNKIGNTATYGSWFNFYMCSFEGRVVLPNNASLPLTYDVGGARCNL